MTNETEKLDKRIEVVYKKPTEIKTNFGNPRKIKKKKAEELAHSLETLGDFGVLVIDENDSIICGNQRLAKMLQKAPDSPLLCKQLIGYSDAEKRAINIKGNEHAGEWDLDLLASWTADLNLEFGIDKSKNTSDREIEDMELLAFEKYDYVLIACKTTLDYENLKERLGIKTTKMKITDKKKIKARAVWFDDISDRIG
jgi:hypothetical protein